MQPSIISLRIDGESLKVPKWLNYFFDVGWSLGGAGDTNKYRIVMTVPSGYLASLFLNAGYLMHKSRQMPVAENDNLHFETLCKLEPSTQVTALSGGKRYDRAIFCGVYEIMGESQVKVMLGLKNKTCVYYNKDRACDVIITNRKLAKITNSPHGRRIESNDKFLAVAFGEKEFKSFLMKNNILCEIFGYIKEYKNEIESAEVILKVAENEGLRGALQDIVRVKSFINDGYGWQTELVSVTANDLQADLKTRCPKVTIFDGAVGFLKWRDFRRDSHVLLVLDRSEKSFVEAVDSAKNDFILNRKGENGLLLPTPPLGIETLVYYE